MGQQIGKRGSRSPETERAVLAAVMLRPTVLEDVGLVADDFREPRHRVLWRAMRAVARRGEPIDVRTLQAELEQGGELESVGGVAYLAALDLDLPDLGPVATYGRIARELAAKRRLIGP